MLAPGSRLVRSLYHGLSYALLPCLLLACPSGLAAQDLTTAQQAFERGFALHTGKGDGHLDAALKWYRVAIKEDPGLFEAYSNAGLIYVTQEKYSAAEQYLGTAIKLARERDDIDVGTEAKVSSDLGSCYYQWASDAGSAAEREKNYRKAEEWFRSAIHKDPGLAEAHFNLINLMLKKDRREEAKAAMEEAARRAPDERYGLFEGRLKGKEGWEQWNPTWVKVIAGILVVVLVVYTMYAWMKGRGVS